MKDPRLLVGLIVLLALGALLLAANRTIGALQRQVARFHAAEQTRTGQAARANSEVEELRRQVADLKQVIAQFEARNKEIAANGPGARAPESKTAEEATNQSSGFGKMMEKMFTDPEMKKAMKSQQAMAIQMMYGDLAKELNLVPEEARLVTEILVERQMALAAKSMKMFSGNEGALETDGKELQTSVNGFNQQLEGILGKERHAQFEQFERTLGERMQIAQYKQAFNASGVPLDETQSQGLLAIMKEERLQQPPSPLDPGSKDVTAAVQAMQTEGALEKAMAGQEAMNRRVLDRARNVLSPDQIAQFEQIQNQHFEMQKMGIKMGREMMKK